MLDTDRNRIGRMFGTLKQQRRITTRYEKTVMSFASFRNLATARLWLKSFVNTAQDITINQSKAVERPIHQAKGAKV